MGLISDLRTIKRGVSGDMDRDLEYITAPAGLLLDEYRSHTLAELKRAVSRRTAHEATLDPGYLRGLYESLEKDKTGLGRTILMVSNLAGIAVARGDYTQLLEMCAHVDANHWLVHELDAVA